MWPKTCCKICFASYAVSEGFRRADKPAAFAFRTAMNLAFDWRRSKKRMLTSDADIAAQPSPAASVISDLVRREELEKTLSAIGELPAMNRDILVLRYLQQQSYETIADQFGKTAHQIRALVHKALESLRKLLGADAENGQMPKALKTQKTLKRHNAQKVNDHVKPAKLIERFERLGPAPARRHRGRSHRRRAQAAIDALPSTLLVQPAPTRNWNRRLWRPRNLIAAAAAILLLIFAAHWFLTRSDSNFAFAQVQEEVVKTKSVQYVVTASSKSNNGTFEDAMTTRVQIVGEL